MVFKLNTKQPVSVNRVTIIPTSDATTKTVNDIGEQENQPEGIEFSDLNGRVTLQDFAENDIDEDSNASDEDFVMDKEYEDEEEHENALDERDGIINNDEQEDYFQTPIQQHNNVLNNTAVPVGKQECTKKKKNTDEENSSMEDNLDDDRVADSLNTKVGVNDIINNDENVEQTGNDDATPKELGSDLGPYWTLAQSSHAYVLGSITSYSNIEASKSTPQYGFNRGLKEFGELGYEATVKELDDNLLGMGAVKMVNPKDVTKI